MDVSVVHMPGPGSLHWRYGGEVRGYLLLVKAGLLQLMHPGLGAGVEQHSDFFNEPWERVLRSVPLIQGTTFDSPYQMINQFDHPMTDAEKEQLYQEACEIYRAYGVSDRVMPRDWPSFEAYFDRMCRAELEITPAARGLIEFTKNPPPTFPLI